MTQVPPLRIAPHPEDPRTPDRIYAHYVIERELADRLRNSDRVGRKGLYKEVYGELFARVPDHPLLLKKVDEAFRAKQVAEQIRMLERFLTPESTFLEIGAGDCALSLAIARRVKKAIAIDVQNRIAEGAAAVPNFSLVLTDGQTIPVPPGSVTLAYSTQMMEHLHPDDAEVQLASIREALAPGGVYVCITPSRLNGPHDVSMYFDEVATCTHLHEYTIGSFAALARRCGFSKVQALPRLRGRSALTPVWPFALLEGVLDALPAGLRGRIARLPVLRAILEVSVAAWR